MPLEIKIEETFIYKEGKVKGRIEGRIEVKNEMIIALLKKGKFSQEDIAEAANVPLAYVKALADNL
jgi:predicted transposase YdaD